MTPVLVVAPHPDDETLGCGGSLLRHRALGDEVHWLIVTGMHREQGYSGQLIADRETEIAKVSEHYGMTSVHCLNLPTTRLDAMPLSDVIEPIAAVFERVMPAIAYLPFAGDAHSDHRLVAAACGACVKPFRNSSIREILIYETLSETDFQIDPSQAPFRPNLYVDIAPHLEGKLAALRLYPGEIGEFPFPRSPEAVEALARKRGVEAGMAAAEAFMIARKVLK